MSLLFDYREEPVCHHFATLICLDEDKAAYFS
jgi:hypothetical protein